MLKKFEDALNLIPRVTATIGAVKGEIKGYEQNCCPPGDPCAAPMKKGQLEGGLTVTASVSGRLWGPPSIRKKFDWGFSSGLLVINIGVDVNFTGSIGGSLGKKWNECLGENCVIGSVGGSLEIGFEAKIEAKAKVCLWGCAKFGVDITPAKISTTVSGKATYDSCGSPSVSGTFGLEGIKFSASFKVGPISIGYEYQIYP